MDWCVGSAEQVLDNYEINDWHNYMMAAASNAVLLKLIVRGVVPKELNCGNCIYLSLSRPHACRLTDDPKLKGDPSCSEYSLRSGQRKNWAVASEEEGPHYREELFTQTMPNQETMGSLSPSPEEQALAEDLYDKFEQALKERILDARTPHEEKKYNEEHLIFKDMMELMDRGHSEADAKAELVKSIDDDRKRDSGQAEELIGSGTKFKSSWARNIRG